MTPPEFEAAAGCSKGKNWKVSYSTAGACQCLSCIMQPTPVPPPPSPPILAVALLLQPSPLAVPPFTLPSDPIPVPI